MRFALEAPGDARPGVHFHAPNRIVGRALSEKSDVREIPTEVVSPSDVRGRQRLILTWNGGSIVHDLPSRGALVVGRGAEADLRVDHSSVSRNHARVVLGETITVADLGSSNGTWVDGTRLTDGAPASLRPGSLVEIGSVLMVIDSGVRSTTPARTDDAKDAVVVVDPEMARVHELVDLVARANLSVVLLGETGVGKDVLAHRVHQGSPRASKPFLKVNCAALSESLVEAELFGFERGAFTGAAQAKEGLLEGASGGTLFLDELGELPLTTQAKLLRVLESGEVTRLGALKPRPINVRFVSATNRDLRELIAAGRFRQDLFFRLDGLSIYVPPLRDRVAEVSALALAFVRSAAVTAGKPPVTISEDAMTALRAHAWPGNVRELKNVIARSVLLCRSTVLQASDLHLDGVAISRSAAAVVESVSASDLASERERIALTLDRYAGNQTLAAKALGMSRRTLLKRLDSLALPRPRKRGPSDES